MADVANAINEFKRRKDLGEDVNYLNKSRRTNTFTTLIKVYKTVLKCSNLPDYFRDAILRKSSIPSHLTSCF